MLCACAMVAGALQGQTEATAEGPSEQRASGRSDPNGAQRNEGARPKNYTIYIRSTMELFKNKLIISILRTAVFLE
jgi:hypothetical protein